MVYPEGKHLLFVGKFELLLRHFGFLFLRRLVFWLYKLIDDFRYVMFVYLLWDVLCQMHDFRVYLFAFKIIPKFPHDDVLHFLVKQFPQIFLLRQ